MHAPLEPHPPVVFDETGAPASSLYGDVFRSRTGARAEAREVFVHGCALPGRWRTLHDPGAAVARPFAILELGFGAGVNFLETLAAWREAAVRGVRLHYVSIEGHPLRHDDLARVHAALGCADADARRLQDCWPQPLPGLHGIDFADGEVRLTLAFGAAERLLERLPVAADAIFLDGFSPARNPAIWSAGIARALARKARPGASFSTWTAAAGVRDAFAAAGFAVERVTGHAGKKHRLQGRYAPRWRGFPPPPEPPSWPSNQVLVIGAGLAGAAVAAGFARDGWQVQVLDEAPAAGRGASAQPLVADHLHLSIDDNVLARLTRAALGWRARASPGPAAGKLVLDRNEAQAQARRRMLDALAFPASWARHLHAAEASDLAGIPLPRGALWLPLSHVEDPRALMNHWLADPAIDVRYGVRVERLLRETDGVDPARDSDSGNGNSEPGEWTAFSTDGSRLARAAVVVLANAGDAIRLGRTSSIPLRPMLGQSTWLPAAALPGLRRAVSGLAWGAPVDGRILAGATFEPLEPEAARAGPVLDPRADAGNLRRLARMLAADDAEARAFAATWTDSARSAAGGVRWSSPDHLPMIGAMPDEPCARARTPELARNARLPLPRLRGLYGAFGCGARGTLWAALAGAFLPAMAAGAPPPIETDLVRVIDPARYLWRAIHQ